MPKVNDKQIAIARTYSRAILNLAEPQGKADELQDELVWLADFAASDEGFAHFISSPLIDAEDRTASIEKMFRGRLSDILVDALQVIHNKERLELLPSIAETYRQELRDRRGRIDVYVRTAVAIDDSIRQKIETAIQKHSGKAPDLHEEIDEALIGGIVLHVADQKVDASVLNEIRKFRQILDNRSALEIQRSRHEVVEE